MVREIMNELHLEALKNFQCEEFHSTTNQATLIGKINGEAAIVLITPPTLNKQLVTDLLSKFTKSTIQQKNDKFSKGSINSETNFGFVLIHPANDEDVAKYSAKKHIFVDETMDDYKKTLENKLVGEANRSKWIYNIIENMEKCDITDLVNISDPSNSHLIKAYEKQIARKGCNSHSKIIVPRDYVLPEKVANNSTFQPENIQTEFSSHDSSEADSEIGAVKNHKKAKITQSSSKNNKHDTLETTFHRENVKEEDPVEFKSLQADTNIDGSNTNQPKASGESESCTNHGTKPPVSEILPYNKKSDLVKNQPTDTLDTPSLKEKILYNSDDFFIIVNYQWNMDNLYQLYLNVMFKASNIYTLRDIKNLDILIRAKDAIKNVCLKKFGLEYQDVYVFFHYHPTYYKLHLHVRHADYVGFGSNLGKAIMLEDVITNLSLDINYYRNINLRFKSISQNAMKSP